MGSRILLADDSITIQKVVNLTFADEGIEVVAVSNGDVAERRLNEVKPDLVLADIFMPGKNGYELCEAIKQNSQFRNVPVVLLVGAFEPFDQVEARRVRADAHLTKPFESRTLVETVRRLIGATRHTTGPIAQMPSPGEDREERFEPEAMPPRMTTPTGPKLDLSEMMVDHDPAPATSATGNTGELAATSAGVGAFDVGVIDTPAPEPVDAGLTESSGEFEPMEMPPIGDFAHIDLQSPSGQGDPDMILDFDRPDPLESSSQLGSVSFETEARTHLDVDLTEAGNGAGLFTPHSFDSRAFEIPSTSDGWDASTTTAGPGVEPPAHGLHDESAFAHSESSGETACATMLAGDEPLGDVLLDETVSAGLMSFSQDALDIELTQPPPEIDLTSIGSAQFDPVDTTEDSSHEFEAIHAVEDKPGELDVHANEATATWAHEPADAAASPVDSQLANAESNDILDWTSPTAGSYSTAQFDSVMMPIETAEYVKENPSDNGAQPPDSAEEASFETAQSWPEEEARFTAIDIEAFPVEDAGELKSDTDQSEAGETGFSFSPATPGQASLGGEVGPAGNAAPSEPTTCGAQSQSELSSAAIDEIVRRVVAEMSESVVREVAWEVVPDCVERVIDQLTRETLSKQL